MKNLSIQLFSLFLLFGFTACGGAQKAKTGSNNLSKSEMIVGTWKFADVGGKEDMDPKGLKFLESFYGDMMFTFTSENRFSAAMMGKEDAGGWQLNNAEDKLIMTSDKEGQLEFGLIDLTTDQMTIQMEKFMIILKRS